MKWQLPTPNIHSKISFKLIKQDSPLNHSVKTALLLGLTLAKAVSDLCVLSLPYCLVIREDLSCATHKICPLCIKTLEVG